MPQHQVHLVGGVPLANAEDVFTTASRILGAALPRIPDGEVGRKWMEWFAPIITDNTQLQKTDEEFRPHAGGASTFRYRLAPGVRVEEQVVFSAGLRHAAITLESYAVFKALKDRGVVRPEVRFQCTLAHPIPIIRRYFPEELQDAIEPALENAILGEVKKIADAIPHDQLAIQWDCASAVFATLELGKPSRFGQTREAMYGALAERLARFGRAVPADVELLYHFCYGNSNGRHSIEPSSTRDAVAMSNRITALLGPARPIQLIHLPVPIARDDDAYFAPLRELQLHPQTMMALGLVHLRDGIEGTRRRMATANRFMDRYAIGTECGLSHAPKDRIADILRLQAELAA